MLYFSAKNDLEFLIEFKKNVEDFINIEQGNPGRVIRRARTNTITIVVPSNDDTGMDEDKLRERIAKTLPRAMVLARRLGMPIDLISYPPPAVGGPAIPVNLFHAILNDTSYGGIDRQHIIDAINQTIGQYECLVEQELNNLRNPFYWSKYLFNSIIRLPYTILKMSGFNVEKIEEHLWAKFMNLLWILAVIYILVKFGLDSSQITNILMKIAK